MMKTHEEIKKTLECYADYAPCVECPYRLEVGMCIGMIARWLLTRIRTCAARMHTMTGICGNG